MAEEVWCIGCNEKPYGEEDNPIVLYPCGHEGIVCKNCTSPGPRSYHRCYACSRGVPFVPNAQPQKCLMCNRNYLHPYCVGLRVVTAQCDHQGVGNDCCVIDVTGHGCHLNPKTTDCYACRHPFSPPSSPSLALPPTRTVTATDAAWFLVEFSADVMGLVRAVAKLESALQQ
jgi:hypothetical protein